eukprot:CAMPEP_0202727494 /NCGR_PEP_ID=MMETSP1385-20130828/185150_1 /ASSEMBLY_ACC=CAM_ASM_000861 /TAXON_ID=933848 /ORGANISM="Elphidium margaritaceum" /LENGTH=526 /DNA_ID=CAMNT_0049393735 /DNA_START=35 /DNA_END=1615 /DNA_ORIENTATION=-
MSAEPNHAVRDYVLSLLELDESKLIIKLKSGDIHHQLFVDFACAPSSIIETIEALLNEYQPSSSATSYYYSGYDNRFKLFLILAHLCSSESAMHFSTQCSLFRDAIALKLHAILFNLVFPCKAAVRSQYNKVRKICETWSTQNLFDLKSYVIKNIVNDLNNNNNCLYILNEDDYEEPPNLDQFIQQQQQQQQQPPVYRSQYEYVYNAPLAPQSSSQRQPPPPQSHQSHAQSQSQYAPLDSVASMHMNRDTTRYDNNSHSYNQHHRQQNQSAPYYDQYSSSASRGAYQNRNRINTHNTYQPRYTHNTSTSDAYHNNNNNNNNNRQQNTAAAYHTNHRDTYVRTAREQDGQRHNAYTAADRDDGHQQRRDDRDAVVDDGDAVSTSKQEKRADKREKEVASSDDDEDDAEFKAACKASVICGANAYPKDKAFMDEERMWAMEAESRRKEQRRDRIRLQLKNVGESIDDEFDKFFDEGMKRWDLCKEACLDRRIWEWNVNLNYNDSQTEYGFGNSTIRNSPFYNKKATKK